MHKYFEWDENKNKINLKKHGIDFKDAQHGFKDKKRIIAYDTKHSNGEERYYCFSKIDRGILTIRFTYRGNKVRIFGAGFWNKGRKAYAKENNIHR